MAWKDDIRRDRVGTATAHGLRCFANERRKGGGRERKILGMEKLRAEGSRKLGWGNYETSKTTFESHRVVN